MTEDEIAVLLAKLSESEQRMGDWRARFARVYEIDKDEAIGGIYDRCMALEVEVQKRLHHQIDQAHARMFGG